MQYPKKSEDVYVEALEDELCVYDWERQKMHALNPTAALVFEHCDGQTTPAELATRLETDLNVPDAEKLVWLSLDRLEKAHLLEEKVPPGNGKRGLTRREVLKMAGISLALLPVVKSIVLPTPMLAASCSVNCITIAQVNSMVGCDSFCSQIIGPDWVLCSVGEAPVLGTPLVDCECRSYRPANSPISCR